MAKEYFVKEGDVDVLRDNVDKKISSPNTAEVGQILSVKAIDGNGKPTEWEVVNKPGSGPGESSPYIYMTQAEYEALTEYEQDKMYWVTYPFTGCYLVWQNGIAIMGEGCTELAYFSDSSGDFRQGYICTNRNIVINFNPKKHGFARSYWANSTSGSSGWERCKTHVEKLETTNNVTKISDYCFSENTKLKEIKLSESVTSIGDYAFSECEALLSINIPDSVTSIGYQAFAFCTKLETAVLGNGITELNSDTFKVCNALELIVINKPQDSVSGAPWGATNATVVWTG